MNNNKAEMCGVIVNISQPREIGPNRAITTVVVKYDRTTNRAETVPIDFFNMNREMLNGLGVGARVIVSYYPGGNQHKNDPSKYFPTFIGESIAQI